MRKIIAISCLLGFTGCASMSPDAVIVPVATECPKPPVFEELKLPIDNIKKISSHDYKLIAESYLKSILLLRKRVEEQKQYLDVYRNQEQ